MSVHLLSVERLDGGTLSGTRAGIKVIGYVGPYAEDKRGEMEKVLRDAGDVDIMREWSEFPAALRKIEAGEV